MRNVSINKWLDDESTEVDSHYKVQHRLYTQVQDNYHLKFKIFK